jgi:hypothetical protein
MQAEIEQITRPEEEFIGDDDWERSDPEDDVFGGGGDGDRDGDGEEDRDGDRDDDREEDADRARDGDIIEDVPAASSVSTTGSCNRQPVSPDIHGTRTTRIPSMKHSSMLNHSLPDLLFILMMASICFTSLLRGYIPNFTCHFVHATRF